MSVVGLTLGTAANATRPSAANAASVATRATIRASGRVALIPGEARGEGEHRAAEGADLPAHTSPPVAADRRATSARPLAGVSAPPAPPRIRAVSVAK